MNFGNKPLASDGDGQKLGGIIFDSGSSYTYFTNKAYGALLSTVSMINDCPRIRRTIGTLSLSNNAMLTG